MFDFTIDRSKAVELANNLGLKVSFGASSPGIRINNGEDSMFFSIKEFFPELNSLEENNFVNEEYDSLKEIADRIVIVVKKSRSIDSIKKFKKYSFYNANAA